MNCIDDIRISEVTKFPDKQGLLVAYNGMSDLQTEIQRVFVVTGHANSRRGKHAHKALTQVLVCVHGACRVTCDDGTQRREFFLNQPEAALIIPSGIWAEQLYIEEDTILVVLCDLPYDEADYIRDYDHFLAFRKGAGK